MSMGQRKDRQEELFILTEGLPKSAGHPFYRALNRLLAEANFDRWVHKSCSVGTFSWIGNLQPTITARFSRFIRSPANSICHTPAY
jgi:hypothetical protein